MPFETVVNDLMVNEFSPWSSNKLLRWDTASIDTLLKDGDKIIADTSSGPVTLTLPLGVFTQIQVKRIGVNLLTINLNGQVIEGNTDDRIFSTNGDFGTYIQSDGTNHELRSNGKIVFIQDIIDVLQITNPFDENTTAQQILDWLGAMTSASFTLTASDIPYTITYDSTSVVVCVVTAVDDILVTETTGSTFPTSDTLTIVYTQPVLPSNNVTATTNIATITTL